MKKNLKIILISTLLLGCGNRNKTESKTWSEGRQKMEYTFSDYSEKIPLITLPLYSTCDNELKGSRFGFTDKEISKYGTETSEIYGKLADKDKYTAIIYLYPADVVLPIILTTDKKGNRISELKLYDVYCGENEIGSGSSWFRIDSDLTIDLNDSSVSFHRDDKDEIIEETKKTTVRHRQFYISDNGKIIERKQKTTP